MTKSKNQLHCQISQKKKTSLSKVSQKKNFIVKFGMSVNVLILVILNLSCQAKPAIYKYPTMF